MIRSYFPSLICIFTCLTFIFPACNSNLQNPISGHITLQPDWRPVVYLVRPQHFNEIAADYTGEIFDSATIAQDGSFAFKHIELEEPKTLALLVVQKHDSKHANHLADEIPAEANYMPVVLAASSSIVLEADITRFQKTYTIAKPSSGNQQLIALRDIRIDAFDILHAATSQDTDNDSLLLEREDAYNRYTKVLRDFADSTRSFEAALIATRWVSPSGDFERTPEFLHGQCQKWSNLQPDHPFTQELCIAADKQSLPVMIGDSLPDYPMPLVTGDTIMLRALLGRRLTIVDIWASWCAPCRKENRLVLGPVWSAYKENGLQIIGYSIDGDASAWKTAIEKDGIQWTNASHLSGDATPFLDALRIATIPANFIVDANGNILAKNIFGEQLTEFIRDKMVEKNR